MKQTLTTKIFNLILVVLGFASGVSCEPRIGPVEYGQPHMDFEVSGKVVDEDSAPIAGIKISYNIDKASGIATVFTTKDGSFFISENGATAIKPDLLMKFEDIDGAENGGEFAEKTEEIKVEQIEEGNGWYEGKYEAKDVVVKMKKKQ